MASSQTFAADIAEWVRDSEAKMKDVLFNAIQDTVEEAQTPTGKGGRMRVDTGFLRASGRASLTGMPSGRGEKTDAERALEGKYTGALDDFDGTAVSAIINTMELGDSFYFGWVARYAETRELYDGFLITATQNWQLNVNRRAERFK